MKLAVIQMPVGKDKGKNIQVALDYLARAKAAGADMAVLPEMWNCPYSNASFGEYAEEAGGPTWRAMSEAAKAHQLYLVAGSIPEREAGNLYNTSFVFDDKGRQIAFHRKMHLFDIDITGGQRFRESDTLTAGNAVTTFSTSFGMFGLCICFDFRFPELARLMTLQGAQALIVPAAFNMTTGPMHWELIFRQRAVDNQLYTVGISPARDEMAGYVAYGNSMACSPWGQVMVRAEGAPELLLVDLDFEEVKQVREQLPLLQARRTDIYS